ncbi:hypothetical protein AcV5_003710 [Taiwanofungus camphoratus]|nr:hypothetical protein AcV5_003710 [Antrodia cinnamomea]
MAVHPPQTFRDFPDNPVSNYGKNIIDDFQTKLCQNVANIPDLPLYLPLSFRDILNKVGGGHLHPPPNDAPSCIIPVPTDAKVGGLYAAKLLEEHGIDYEILEASPHTGGRIYTHNFSQKEHDCYDVGAMRFPDIPIMKPLFELFRDLKLDCIKYYFKAIIQLYSKTRFSCSVPPLIRIRISSMSLVFLQTIVN